VDKRVNPRTLNRKHKFDVFTKCSRSQFVNAIDVWIFNHDDQWLLLTLQCKQVTDFD